VDAILAAGWSEIAIYHAAAVTALSNCMNRLVEGLGIEFDPVYAQAAAVRLADISHRLKCCAASEIQRAPVLDRRLFLRDGEAPVLSRLTTPFALPERSGCNNSDRQSSKGRNLAFADHKPYLAAPT
jgi:hypothetical protein